MEGLDRAQIDAFIENALYEDVRDGDHTSLSTIPADKRDKAKLLVKDVGVIAGVDLAKMIFEKVDPSYELSLIHI